MIDQASGYVVRAPAAPNNTQYDEGDGFVTLASNVSMKQAYSYKQPGAIVLTNAEAKWRAAFIPEARAWGIYNDDWEGEYVAHGLTKEQALFGVTLLRYGGIDVTQSHSDIKHEIDDALTLETCFICEKHFAKIQMHGERCPSCLS